MGLQNGDVLQVSIVSSVFGQRVRLLRHYLFDGVGNSGQTVPEALDEVEKLLFDNGANDVLDRYREIIPANVSIDATTTQIVSPLRSVRWESTKGVPGLFVGNATTVNVAGAITFRTDLAGRNQISTIHVGPLAAEQMDQGRLTAPTIVLMAGLADVLDQGVDGTLTINGALLPVIWNPTTGAKLITSHSVGGTVRTMRRRTVGIGE